MLAVVTVPGDVTKTAGRRRGTRGSGRRANPGARTSSYFTTGSDLYVSKDRHTAFEEIFIRGQPGLRLRRRRRGKRATRCWRRFRHGATGSRHRRRRHPGVEQQLGRPVDPRRDADRRARRADHPALRLRDAAGGRDAVAHRRSVDPQHVHARLGPDLHHERLDHRPVPDRARRARCRDRLRAADDLPLPRRAASRRDDRGGDRHDDGARRPLGDRLRLDRRRRPAEHDRAAAAVHPLDRYRRHVDSRRLGAHSDHAATGDARHARAADQPRARDAQEDRRGHRRRRRASGSGGPASCASAHR